MTANSSQDAHGMSSERGMGVPATTNVRGAEYPRIHSNGRVTFRLEAPGAKSVQLQPGAEPNGLGKGPLEMARGEDGAWWATTTPAVPGLHYYWMVVDGMPVNDPGSETFFGYARHTSGVEVPEPGVDFYALKDVPHGEVRARWYRSQSTGGWRRVYVYTPPDYDKGMRRYPALYLQHGAGEDERAWTAQGRANFILDNLVAEGQAEPMIVVMENGYTLPNQVELPRGPELMNQIGDALGVLMLRDLIPMIDACYRTIPEREKRAIAGLSMGGRQAFQIGLSHPDTFGWTGAFSGVMMGSDFPGGYGCIFQDPDLFRRQVQLLWLSAGTEEERFRQNLQRLHDSLTEMQIPHEVFLSQGTAHEWQTWRRSLLVFAQRLFRA